MASAAAHGDAVAKTVGEAIGRARLTGPIDNRYDEAGRLLLLVEGAMFLTAMGLVDVAHRGPMQIEATGAAKEVA